jgi:multiple sugar transport system substrate-binding protein
MSETEGTLRILLVGGPMYDPLYPRLKEFENREEISVEVVATLAHPDLNERIEEEFSSGTATYDLISTHTKYAPSQKQWLTPLDHDLDESELENFTPRNLELARIDGLLYGVPRNLDVKLLYYRTDLMDGPPSSWEELREEAARLRTDGLYGFVFPGKESGLFGHFFELHAMAGGRMFEDEGPPIPRLNDEAGRWALNLLRDLYEQAAPEETPEWHYDEVAACFRRGEAAMSTDWPGRSTQRAARDASCTRALTPLRYRVRSATVPRRSSCCASSPRGSRRRSRQNWAPYQPEAMPSRTLASKPKRDRWLSAAGDCSRKPKKRP